MKLTFILLVISFMQVSANVYSQERFTLDYRHTSVEKIFSRIQKESDYRFFYTHQDIEKLGKVDIRVKAATLPDILNHLLSNVLGYKIIGDKMVIISSLDEINVPITVKGTVTDSSGAPLAGVTVKVKGENKGVYTDANGQFSIAVADDAVLQVSYVGYQTKEVAVAGKSVLSIVLRPNISSLEQLVVIGYGTQRKEDLTGAISSIDADELNTAGKNSVAKALQGKLPGVEIESAGGAPGSGVRILIRGVGTWNNNTPLYIVDGVQVSNIDNLNPTSIASISVLKDASAAAIYGSRAANGVVLVTTKSGTSGEPAIQLNAYFGIQQLPHKLNLLNAGEYARMNNAAHDGAGIPRLDLFGDPASLGQGTDWQNQIYRTAPVQDYNLSMSGGKGASTYSITLGYHDQNGIVDITNYKRMSLRAKSQTTKGRFTLGETAIITKEDNRLMTGGWGGQGGNPVGTAALMIPVFKVYDPAAIGGYGGAYGPVVNIANPVAQLHLENIKSQSVNIVVNAFAKIDLLKGLYYKLNFGYTNDLGYNYDYTHRYQVGTLFANPTNNLSESSSRSPFLMLENTLHYEHQFGKSRLKLLAGYTSQKNEFRVFSGSVNDLPDGITESQDAGAGIRSSGGSARENTLLSILGRVNYSFDQRYLFTASIRRDGSSRFSPANQYGNFPSLALGWVISEENFFKPLASAISYLKLRASWGILGNQEFADYSYLPSVALNQNYAIGRDQHLWFGAIQTSVVDPYLKWEESKTIDFGMDVNLLHDKLNFTLDYYNKRTSGILLGIPVPGSLGVDNNPITNAGAIENHGLEASVSYADMDHQFKYNIHGTFSTVRNKVLSLSSGQPLQGGRPNLQGGATTTTKVGGPVGAFYLIKTDGIFNSEEEVEAYQSKDGNMIQPGARPGDIRFVDANGDGTISSLDRVYCGSPFPKLVYGFGVNGSWEGFDFSFFFQGTYGNKIYNGFAMSLESMTHQYNWDKKTLNAWTPEKHTDFPRADINDPNSNSQVSTRFLETGSYLRLKDLQIGYTFSPEKLEKIIGVTSLRAYISLANIITITKYSGYNPDIGRSGSILDRGVDFDNAGYPLSRSMTFGVNLAF